MIILTNQEVLSGTPEEIVTALASGVRLGSEEAQAFMAGVARRCKIWDGTKVRTERAVKFLKDIEAAGLIIIEQE